MLKLRKTAPLEPLIVAMTGLRLGDRVLFAGCADPKAVALLALKPGLTGRACAVDEEAALTAGAAEAAQREGVLLEVETAPLTMLPFEAGSFDVVVVARLLSRLAPDRRAAALGEAARVLRPGGRCVVIEAGRRGGLAGLFAGPARMPLADIESAMRTASLRGVRTLAERDGLVFAEGAKG